jgi:hypothetical protein
MFESLHLGGRWQSAVQQLITLGHDAPAFCFSQLRPNASPVARPLSFNLGGLLELEAS